MKHKIIPTLLALAFAATLIPAAPNAMSRSTSVSWSAICSFSYAYLSCI